MKSSKRSRKFRLQRTHLGIGLEMRAGPRLINAHRGPVPENALGIIDDYGRKAVFPLPIVGSTWQPDKGGKSAAEFQKILDHSGIVWNWWTGALARLGVARSHALEARTLKGADADAARARALADYKDFLTLWKDADPDIRILTEAKQEYAKLQQE